MRKSALMTLFLMILFVLSSLSVSTVSSSLEDNGSGIGNAPSTDGWWNNWVGDKDHNKIDDILDDMIENNPKNQRTRIFIDYSRKTTSNDVDLLNSFDLGVKFVYKIINTINAQNVLLSDIEKLSKLPQVVMIEYEHEVQSFNDVGARAVKARNSTEYSPNTVWDMGFFGEDISIAILDSGVDDGPSPAPPPYHLSLDDLDDDITTVNDPKFIAGVDFTRAIAIIDGSYNPDDGMLGHGTHCAGTAMGTGDTSDYKGVAPQARLVDVKVMENWGSGVMGDAVRGIEWCVEHADEFNIRVLSMSIGANYNSDGQDAASQAVNAAVDAGIVAVVAAGNGGTNTIGPPAAADKALVVGALNDHDTVNRSDDNVWGSSNVGPRANDGDSDPMDELKPDVLAPGVNIWSAKSDTSASYAQFSGTSMATPHVAGVVALILEANPDLTPQEVKDIIHMTAEMPDEIDPSTEHDDTYNYAYGWGFIDAFMAVKMALADDLDPPTISEIDVEVSGNTAVISWLTDKPANSIVEYGNTTALGSVEEDLDNYEFTHSITLKDLDLDTDYYYNIKGYDENGVGPGESGIQDPFHTDEELDTTPPKILDGPRVLDPILDTSATIYWKTDENSTSVVEYGTDITYGNISSDFSLETEHTIILMDLIPDTLYHFRVTSTDASGNPQESSDHFFKTDPEAQPLLITSGPTVNSITNDSATITWETDDYSTTLVRYGKTQDYELGEKYDDNMNYYHSVKLTGLKPTTKYFYQVESTNDEGTSVVKGDASNYFTTTETPDNTKPEITDIRITILTDESASIEWVTNEESTSWVDFGEGNPGTEPSVGSNDYDLEHNISLTGLKPSTKYYFQVRSADRKGNERVSEKDSFITLEMTDKEPPSILTGPSVWAIGETSATIVWTTDEDSDSTVFFGTTVGYGSSQNESSLTTSHQVILTDLDPATSYHFKVASSDEAGNTVESADSTFETLDMTSPLEINFQNLNPGETVSGIVTIRGTVTGGLGNIKSVRYKIDEDDWSSTGSTSSFTILLDTSEYSEGEHTLTVEAKVGEMTVQEDISFVIEHKEDDSSDAMVWILIAILALVIIVVVVLVAIKSRRKPYSQDTANYGGYDDEPELYSGDYLGEIYGLGFIPDEEPEPSIITDAEVSFVPDSYDMDSEISFIPDEDSIQFNISEEPELGFHAMDNVRCPRCRGSFEADLASPIECPHCGFSAALKQ